MASFYDQLTNVIIVFADLITLNPKKHSVFKGIEAINTLNDEMSIKVVFKKLITKAPH